MNSDTGITETLVMRPRSQLHEDVVSNMGEIGPGRHADRSRTLFRIGRRNAGPDQENGAKCNQQTPDQYASFRAEAPIDIRARAP